MLRVRFTTDSSDYRPVLWPIKHPYWCSGYTYSSCGDRAIIVAYADDENYVKQLWPDYEDFEVIEEVDYYIFSSRFPKPEWKF